jgi:acyl-CoA thioesterase FadM
MVNRPENGDTTSGPDGGLTDAEYLHMLRMEYLESLQLDDVARIETVIIPRFWERFGRYYQRFENSWKETSATRMAVRVVLDPTERRQAALGWMDQVLKGEMNPLM